MSHPTVAERLAEKLPNRGLRLWLAAIERAERAGETVEVPISVRVVKGKVEGLDVTVRSGWEGE